MKTTISISIDKKLLDKINTYIWEKSLKEKKTFTRSKLLISFIKKGVNKII